MVSALLRKKKDRDLLFQYRGRGEKEEKEKKGELLEWARTLSIPRPKRKRKSYPPRLLQPRPKKKRGGEPETQPYCPSRR